jgi:hypothetical protein
MTSQAASLATALAAALAAFLASSPAFAEGGLGPYRLGMKAAEVQAVKACAPYKPVASTGGLECPAFEIAGKKRNISFIFDPATGGLRKIQVWFYEGRDAAAAEAALVELITYLEGEHGALESNVLPPGAPVTAKALRAAAERAPATGGVQKAQLKPAKNPLDKFVFASLMKSATDWYVFLYVQPPR